MQRPLPPDLQRVVELLGRGYTIREVAEELGISYQALRNRLWRYRRRGYDIPYGRRGRPRRDRVVAVRKMSSRVLHSGERGGKFVRLGRDELAGHIVSMVLDSGGLHTGEIARRLRVWGYRFSRMTLWRAVRKLEINGLVIVDRSRGPRGNFVRPSPRLVLAARSAVGGDVFGGLEGVWRYVENGRRRWEFGFHFGFVGGGYWRVEHHPFGGVEVSDEGLVRDLVSVVLGVAKVVGLGFRDVAEVVAEEWVRSPRPLEYVRWLQVYSRRKGSYRRP